MTDVTGEVATITELVERIEAAFAAVQKQKQNGSPFTLQPVWNLINLTPEVLRELRNAANMRKAIAEHDRFYREDLRYSGPNDPGLDPSCGEDWQRLLDAAALKSRIAMEKE
jgi:hypothetical protein